MYLASPGALHALRGGDLGLAMRSLALGRVGAADQTPEEILSRLAREAQVPSDMVLKAYRDELAALREARDKPAHLRERLSRMRLDYERAAREVALRRSQIARFPEPDRSKAMSEIVLAEKRLAIAYRLMQGLRGDNSMSGLGLWPLLLAPGFILALATAFAIVWFTVKTGAEVSDALRTGANVAAVLGGFLGILYFVKVAHDIWAGPQAVRR